MKLQELLYASAKKVPGFKVSTKKVLDGQALYESLEHVRKQIVVKNRFIARQIEFVPPLIENGDIRFQPDDSLFYNFLNNLYAHGYSDSAGLRKMFSSIMEGEIRVVSKAEALAMFSKYQAWYSVFWEAN